MFLLKPDQLQNLLEAVHMAGFLRTWIMSNYAATHLKLTSWKEQGRPESDCQSIVDALKNSQQLAQTSITTLCEFVDEVRPRVGLEESDVSIKKILRGYIERLKSDEEMLKQLLAI